MFESGFFPDIHLPPPTKTVSDENVGVEQSSDKESLTIRLEAIKVVVSKHLEKYKQLADRDGETYIVLDPNDTEKNRVSVGLCPSKDYINLVSIYYLVKGTQEITIDFKERLVPPTRSELLNFSRQMQKDERFRQLDFNRIDDSIGSRYASGYFLDVDFEKHHNGSGYFLDIHIPKDFFRLLGDEAFLLPIAQEVRAKVNLMVAQMKKENKTVDEIALLISEELSQDEARQVSTTIFGIDAKSPVNFFSCLEVVDGPETQIIFKV